MKMPLPLSSSGKIEISLVTDSELLDSKVAKAIAEGLRKEEASDISQDGNQINFRGGGGDNLNPLLPISYGEIDVSSEGSRILIKYHIRFTHIFIFSLLLVFVGGFVLDTPKNNPWGALSLWAIIWSALFGLNALLALIRFPRLLRRSIAQSLHVRPETSLFQPLR